MQISWDMNIPVWLQRLCGNYCGGYVVLVAEVMRCWSWRRWGAGCKAMQWWSLRLCGAGCGVYVLDKLKIRLSQTQS
jgi:hypothetical protein